MPGLARLIVTSTFFIITRRLERLDLIQSLTASLTAMLGLESKTKVNQIQFARNLFRAFTSVAFTSVAFTSVAFTSVAFTSVAVASVAVSSVAVSSVIIIVRVAS